MLREEDPLGPQFSLLPEVLPPPEKSVDPENPKDGDQEAGHHDEGSIEHGFFLRVVMSCMGDPHHKIRIRPGVAFSAILYQTSIGDEGLRVISRQDAVKPVTVRTTRYQFWVTQMLNLSVVTFIIGLSGNRKNLVSLHHLFVCMALLTDLGMKLLSKLHYFGLVTL
jgi:hypothetical protein